ncbi:hypothetical protein LINPERPRIM_LOCUS32828 [Linum perenne]
MEVALPSSPPGMGFDFNDARILPFLSAPSSPRRFGDLTLSVPSSPSRIADFYRSFEDFHNNLDPDADAVTPNSDSKQEDVDFAFDFSSDLEKDSLPADRLFHAGRIRPLEHIQTPTDSDPQNERGRGRRSDRDSGLTSSSSRRATRSVSPYRVSQYLWEDDRHQQINLQQTSTATTTASSCATTTTTKSSSRKWRLRDLLLFRSASEGRAYGKSGFFKRHDHDYGDVKSCNIRSSDSFGSTSNNSGGKPLSRKKAPAVSAHELHYKTNKAASEGMRKKTFLPYKQGILGRFAFIPSHAR